MAQTGRHLHVSKNLVNGQTPISATGTSATMAMANVGEILVTVICTAVAGSGVLNPIVVQYSADGGTTLGTAPGGALATISAVGRQVLHIIQNTGPNGALRLSYTLASGTSVTLVAEAVGLLPTDSIVADAN